LHQPIGLRLADDVEREQDIVGCAGVDEDLCLTKFLAGDPDGAGRHLQLRDRRNLVRLDVRPVADPGARHHRLHAPDVGLQAVQVDRHDGGVELTDMHVRVVLASEGWHAPPGVS